MCILCFISSCIDVFLSLFIPLQWALFIHFNPFCVLTVNSSPCPLHPLSPTHSHGLVPCHLYPTPPLPTTTITLILTFFSSLIPCLTPSPAPCFFLFLSVFCVSRTLMVTQTYWLLAVPWGWDAVSALHLEVLYNLHAASLLNILLYWINTAIKLHYLSSSWNVLAAQHVVTNSEHQQIVCMHVLQSFWHSLLNGEKKKMV